MGEKVELGVLRDEGRLDIYLVPLPVLVELGLLRAVAKAAEEHHRRVMGREASGAECLESRLAFDAALAAWKGAKMGDQEGSLP